MAKVQKNQRNSQLLQCNRIKINIKQQKNIVFG